MISISPCFQLRFFPFSPVSPMRSQMHSFHSKDVDLSSQISAGCSVFSQHAVRASNSNYSETELFCSWDQESLSGVQNVNVCWCLWGCWFRATTLLIANGERLWLQDWEWSHCCNLSVAQLKWTALPFLSLNLYCLKSFMKNKVLLNMCNRITQQTGNCCELLINRFCH